MTKIEWCDEVCNFVTGCTKVSEGCAHCYAERFASRGMGEWKGRKFSDVRWYPERLDLPLRWKRPRRVFVNSMSDLFHEDVPYEFLDHVFGVMATARRHTFVVLTKRPEWMARWFFHNTINEVIRRLMQLRDAQPAHKRHWLDDLHGLYMITERWSAERNYESPYRLPTTWPLPNVWLGVSCENQATADERIPLLLQCPAALRFVSCEPLLGPIDIERTIPCGYYCDELVGHVDHGPNGRLGHIDWVIAGGESGPGARPCNVEWIRSIARQCRDAGVSVFTKQLGSRPYDPSWHGDGTPDGSRMDLRDSKGGDMTEWPEDLRIREWPKGGDK